jgi:hypothetical protein
MLHHGEGFMEMCPLQLIPMPVGRPWTDRHPDLTGVPEYGSSHCLEIRPYMCLPPLQHKVGGHSERSDVTGFPRPFHEGPESGRSDPMYVLAESGRRDGPRYVD